MVIAHILGGKGGVLGGLEKHVVDLSAGQVRRGHQVFVLATASLASYFHDSVTFVSVQMERSRWDPRLKREIKKDLLGIQPDVVHVHANKAASVSGKLLRELGIPSVATVQNVKKDQRMFAGFDRVIAASGVVADSLGGISSVVIRNSVAPAEEKFRESALQFNPPFLQHRGKVVYAAGRFVEAKGYDLLLDAIKGLPETYLWLVGDGPERAMLEDKVQKAGMASRVWMPGFLPVETVLGLMFYADLFLISSRREGGPYTLSEALRCRCPVVSTRVGFASELLKADQLCDAISVESLTEKIKGVLEGMDRYKTAMQPIFETADKVLDLDFMIGRVMDVYGELVAVA